MDVRNWHAAQLGLFWLLLALFSLPVWIGLSIVADFVVGRYAHQDWFEFIPIGLASLVVFLVAGFGLMITWRWLDARPQKVEE